MKRLPVLLCCVVALLAGCGREDWPAEYPVGVYTQAQLGAGSAKTAAGAELYSPNPEVGAVIHETLLKQFGTPAAPKLADADDATNEQIFAGSRIYRSQCMYCHGLGGGGDGPSAASFDPRPRDYRRGAFKWKSSPKNQKPTRDDLYHTISEGISGTSMPPFKLLPERQLRQLIEYVVFLARRGETEFLLLNASLEAPDKPDELKDFLKEDFAEKLQQVLTRTKKEWADAKPLPLGTAERPSWEKDEKLFDASAKRGAQLFLSPKAGCVKCHGVDASGRREISGQTNPDDMIDVWGRPIQPRDLREGIFRGGRTPADLYRRIHEGIPASKMPASGDVLKPEEIWDLVNFVRTLRYRPELLTRPGG